MSRLTKKIFNSVEGYAVNNVPNESDGIYYVNHNVINKLGKLEDLEEELGCPLEVVFKAMTDGIIINEDGYVNSAYDNEEFNEEDSHYSCLNLYKCENDYYFEDISHPYGDPECGGIGCWVKLSDYKKTWWLRGERDVKN